MREKSHEQGRQVEQTSKTGQGLEGVSGSPRVPGCTFSESLSYAIRGESSF